MTSVLNNETERSLNNDLKMGLTNEDIMINKIQQYFPNHKNITNTKQKYQDIYCKWDYECDDGNRFELKSRRLNSIAYSSALLSCHKIDKNCIKKQYFIFSYTNETLYIEYEETLFNTFNIKSVRDYRYGRGGREERCYEIPISKMKQLREN